MIKNKLYPTLVAKVTSESISFSKAEHGRETAELVTRLNNWEKDRRFVVSRVLKLERDRTQLSLIKGDEYEYFYCVTNTNCVK